MKGHIGFRKLQLGKSCNFHPTEIISPITKYTKTDVINFFGTYERILFQENFVYEMNDTQGMHINLSHPLAIQNPLLFLRFWWYFEPIILTFLPKQRHEAISVMARPLRKIFKTLEILEYNWQEYYADGISKFSAVAIKKDRIEIRVIDSNLIPNNILMWLKFLTRLLFVSLTKELSLEDEPSFSNLFLTYIREKDLMSHFKDLRTRYSTNLFDETIE